MNCMNCGSALTPDTKFCSVCGTPIRVAPPQPGYGQQAPNYGQPGYGQQPPSYGGGGINIDSDGRGSGRGYNFELLYQPSFSLAVIKLQGGQAIQAEAGAMVSMSGNIELQSQMKGGLMGALGRMVGGESAFVSTFTAQGGPGEVTFAPPTPGDIAALEMNNQVFKVITIRMMKFPMPIVLALR